MYAKRQNSCAFADLCFWETALSMKHVLRFFTHTALLRTTLSDLRSSKAQNRVPILRFFLLPRFEPKVEWVNEFQLKTLMPNFIKIRSTILHRGWRNDGEVGALGSERT